MVESRGNIAQYTSPVDEIKPSEIGADALAQAGRRIGAEYRQTGQDYKQAIDSSLGPVANIIDQHDTMDEISHGGAALAAMHNNFTTQWNKMASQANPNDTSIQGTFLNDTVEPQLQQFQDGFQTTKGQQWAFDRANEMRTHYGETTSADMSTRAGESRVLNATSQLNQLTSAAYKDPRSADLSMKQIDAVYDGAAENSQGLLSTAEIGKLKTLTYDAKNELLKSAVKGFADSEDPKGPDNARKILDSGHFDQYIPKQEQEQLHKYIDNQEGARQVEKDQKTKVQQYQQTAANQQEVKGIFSSLASGQGYLATQAYANQKISTVQKQNLLSKDGILSLPPEFLASPAYGDGFSQLASTVSSGKPVDSTALTLGVRRQEITPAGAVQLQAISDKMKTPDGLAEVKAQQQVLADMQSKIVKGGALANDPVGQQKYNEMLNTFYPAWDAAVKQGKSPADLADPESKDYIGNIANTFKRSDTQALADVVNAPAPAITKPAAIPPTDKREVGKSYTNPNGVAMWWTSNGWSKNAPAVGVPKPE